MGKDFTQTRLFNSEEIKRESYPFSFNDSC